ncbi:MAG: T9SS type A sorting domain-containing protein [Candidatus Edwardsbacteria bacterium]|nr:T9SS type A sorting domain-containing protein [Candidatus Edwardsbacteria bacterium]MBU1577157.1 T9SS type A sorting domain-containing protein [Candidatus Edwardsbacteria bacterium]MBU2462940.1 T9SS type A sorting domain-containing protein [Candidatus Edwardsbacteria bacterium]
MNFGSLYVLNGDNDLLDTTLSVSTVGIQIACNPIANKLYASSPTYGLYVYDGNNYSQLNYMTGFEGNLYYFPGNQVFVTHNYDSLVGVIDAVSDGINDSIVLGGVTPNSEMVGSPEMQKLYVTLPGRNQVGIINASTNSLITTVSVGTGPSALAYCPEHKKTYVACPGDINIWVIDSMDVASPIAAGDSINTITYNQGSKQICFTDKNNSQIGIVDPGSDFVTQLINLPGTNPSGLFVDQNNGELYVALPSAVGPGLVAIMGYDSLAPTGAAIYDVPAIINTDSLPVFWSPGTDAGGSGIVAYDLYIQPDSTEPSVYTYFPPDTSAILTLFGTDSTMYHLMVVARDSAGNPFNPGYNWQDSVYVDYSYVPAVDTTAPGFPINPTVNGFNPSLWMDSTYTSAPVGWTNPELGITRAYFKLGLPPASPFDRTDSMTTTGGNSDTFNLPIDTLYGVYPAYVWLSDSMGNEDYNNWAVALIRRDIEAPFNTIVLPFSGDTAYSTSFQVNWTGGMDLLSGVMSYRVDYRIDTSAVWNTLVNDYADTFATFTNALSGHRYYFEAAAYDSAYNLEGVFNVAEDSVFVALTPSVNLSTIWNGGAYKLFSVPVKPADNIALANLSDDLGAYSDSTWLMFGYKDSAFVARPDIYNGYGYWLASANNATIDVQGLQQDNYSTVGLQSGWNLIGCPFENPVLVQAIEVIDTLQQMRTYNDTTNNMFLNDSLVRQRMWNYSDNSYDFINNGAWDSLSAFDSASHLQAWQGYAVYALQPCSLFMMPAFKSSAKGVRLVASPKVDVSWQAEFSVISGQAADRGIRIGVSPQAREGYDRLDAEKPPLVSSDVLAYIPHEDWNQGPCRAYQYDFRPRSDHIEWPLTVKTSSEDRPAELTYNLSQTISDGYQLYLVDRKTNKATVLSGSGRLGFSGSREFAVIYTNQGLGGLALKPLSFDLNQTYPNPFARSITVNYQLAAAGQVSLKVYNVTGQLVRTLTEGTALPGYYSQTWNGRDNSGRKIASGIYIMRLVSGGQERTRKLVKIK